ncbi:MAG TPA: hypothetical protein VLD19_17455 [Chitinophagaceae bacterium]|nr:hypothetical protein [Chitinophagaceae bacterium]
MKLTFFLIAFSLVFVRTYLSCTGTWHANNNNVEGNMTIISDNYREEIRWSGIIKLNDDETGIASITPGGYVKYRLNDKKMVAESNLQGEISYSLYNDGDRITIDSNGQKFISHAVEQLVAAGFDAAKRVDRIYQKGGDSALLAETDKQKTDQLKMMYLQRVFAHDSLRDSLLPLALEKIGRFGADNEKVFMLKKITSRQLQDSTTLAAFFETLGRMHSDGDKLKMINSLVKEGPVRVDLFDKIMETTGHLGSDRDKMDVYNKLLNREVISEYQWLVLIGETARLHNDFDKAHLLVQIAPKMPATDNIKQAYLAAAKTIRSDMDYGKVMRAVN